MCDYSLMAIPNRLAVPGDDLVIHQFETGCLGMAAARDLQAKRERRNEQGFWPGLKEFFKQGPGIPAVCIPPGSHLIVRDIPQNLQRQCGLTRHMGRRFSLSLPSTQVRFAMPSALTMALKFYCKDSPRVSAFAY